MRQLNFITSRCINRVKQRPCTTRQGIADFIEGLVFYDKSRRTILIAKRERPGLIDGGRSSHVKLGALVVGLTINRRHGRRPIPVPLERPRERSGIGFLDGEHIRNTVIIHVISWIRRKDSHQTVTHLIHIDRRRVRKDRACRTISRDGW